MYKKTFLLFCVFLALLFVFAACKKRSPYGALIVDKQGMEHVVMTDANGVTVLDSEGNLVEIMTDSNSKKPIAAQTENGTVHPDQVGDYETHAITFPGVMTSGEAVEDAFCKVTLPDGWEQIGNNYLILRHEATDARIMIYTDVGGTATGAIEQLTDEVKELAKDGKFKQNDVMIDGLTVTRTQYEIGNMTKTVYLLVTDNGKVCRVEAVVETDKRGDVDIDALIQSIHFK